MATRRNLIVGVSWVILSVIGLVVAGNTEIHPFGASREARISDDAFDFLLYLSIPVMAFVLVMGGYAVFRDRDRGADEDGAPIRDNRPFVSAWVLITSALAVLVIITPGFTGLDELRAEPEPEVIIDVQGERWSWEFIYVDSDRRTRGTLVLPIDTRVMFRVTSTDVIHSFWIPAMRIKIDAIPGTITTTMVTAEKLGSFSDESLLRVQCAELCGVGHARMWTQVEVVTQEEFEAFVNG
ncbi:MAG: cytochrome c oxidase subunit II [Acidimicrobiales bacterium]|nr:cytochrome c oxidase subunit II [Acidimicrobiales bacterium]